MKTNIEPLQPDCFYHIYNRGINGEDIFKENRNYGYFLQQYAKYVSPYVSTYAYCMLKNHFHLLIRTHSEEEIKLAYKNRKISTVPSKITVKKESEAIEEKDVSWLLSNAFASLFKSYAQAINKAHKRTGRLFEEPFRRIHVDNDAYFSEMIYYIHRNPQKHGFVRDFRGYSHSSYHSHLHTLATKLQREEVISWFGDTKEYEKFHLGEDILINLDKFDIEFD